MDLEGECLGHAWGICLTWWTVDLDRLEVEYALEDEKRENCSTSLNKSQMERCLKRAVDEIEVEEDKKQTEVGERPCCGSLSQR